MNTIPKIEMQIGDASYELATNINALCDLEKVFDTTFNEIAKRLIAAETCSLRDVRSYVTTILRTDGKPISAETASAICQIVGPHACVDAVQRHIEALFQQVPK